jgi:hypothetical protein
MNRSYNRKTKHHVRALFVKEVAWGAFADGQPDQYACDPCGRGADSYISKEAPERLVVLDAALLPTKESRLFRQALRITSNNIVALETPALAAERQKLLPMDSSYQQFETYVGCQRDAAHISKEWFEKFNGSFKAAAIAEEFVLDEELQWISGFICSVQSVPPGTPFLPCHVGSRSRRGCNLYDLRPDANYRAGHAKARFDIDSQKSVQEDWPASLRGGGSNLRDYQFFIEKVAVAEEKKKQKLHEVLKKGGVDADADYQSDLEEELAEDTACVNVLSVPVASGKGSSAKGKSKGGGSTTLTALSVGSSAVAGATPAPLAAVQAAATKGTAARTRGASGSLGTITPRRGAREAKSSINVAVGGVVGADREARIKTALIDAADDDTERKRWAHVKILPDGTINNSHVEACLGGWKGMRTLGPVSYSY